jgi:hypothetical protein
MKMEQTVCSELLALKLQITDASESPTRMHMTFRTQQKFDIKKLPFHTIPATIPRTRAEGASIMK